MNEETDEIKILDNTGGPLMGIPFLGLFEFAFVFLLIKTFRNEVTEAPEYSGIWWVTVIFFAFISVSIGAVIVMSAITAFKTFGAQQYLRINRLGIFLPYRSRPIGWDEVEGCYVTDSPYMKGGAMQFLHIGLSKRKISRRNWFGPKDISILRRKTYDNDEIRDCMALIDRFATGDNL